MKEILDKILRFTSKILPLIILVGVLIISYVIFNASTFKLFNTQIDNPLKSISSLIDDSILYQRSYYDKYHNNDIVIIKIDEKTLDSFSKTDIRMLSFPKKLYSDLIIKLIEEYQVSIIGFDILFSNKSLEWVDDENTLKDTFDKYNDRVVIASMPDSLKSPLCKYNNVQHGSIALVSAPRIKKTLIDTNYKVWEWCEHKDNLYFWNKDTLESFWFTIFKKFYQNNSNDNNLFNINTLFKVFKEENTPYVNINFFRNWENNEWTLWFSSYSLIDILNWEDVNLEWKIVLVWEVGTVLQDNHFTPVDFDRKMPWVEINANIISTFMFDSFLNEFNRYYLLVIILLSSLIILLLIFNNNIISSTIWLIVILLSNIIFWIFAFWRLWIIYPISETIYYLFITYFWMYVYKFFILDKDKRFLKWAFSMFVSPDIVEQISNDPKQLHLDWKKWNITVFFSDIESFTSISEKMDAQTLFDFLNRYFSKMTQILLQNNWTLDKYIWDSVMWFFNAPLSLEKHEYYACKTALEQINELKILNIEFKREWLPILNIRIWINTWEVIHGNLWAKKKRVNYTIIWDNVNLASRLEWVNKVYWTNIIISESVYNKVKKDFIIRELDNIIVKWKEESVKIFELICFINTKYNKEVLKNYSLGLNSYYLWKYKDALVFFSKNVSQKDKPSMLMIKRCENHLSGSVILEKWVHRINEK